MHKLKRINKQIIEVRNEYEHNDDTMIENKTPTELDVTADC